MMLFRTATKDILLVIFLRYVGAPESYKNNYMCCTDVYMHTKFGNDMCIILLQQS